MAKPDLQRSRVFGTPWTGVYATHIDSTRHYGKHWHATYGLGVLEHGAQRSSSGRGEYDAYVGDIITTNPGEVHDGKPLGGPSRRWRMVYWDAEVMATMASSADMHCRDIELTRPVLQDLRLRAALVSLHMRIEAWNDQADDALQLACEESLVTACGLLLQHHSTDMPPAPIHVGMAQVRERLADDMLNPPTLTELAARTGISKYQLLRRFQKTYGVPPHAWLLQHRADQARGLIQRGCSLVNAAAATGFTDQSHMHRVFVRHFGFTPGAWQTSKRPLQ
jgi:AraC-like DNA-binding protein